MTPYWIPRTRLGWLRLWRSLRRRCWYCGGRTLLDPWRDVGGMQGRCCFACGGVENPRGLVHALRLNAAAIRSGEEPK